MLRCSHFFNVDCIDPWLLNKANCPLCKDEVLKGIEWLNDDAEFDNESMSARSVAQVHSAHRHPLDLTFDVVVAGAPTHPPPLPPPPQLPAAMQPRVGGGYSPRLPRAGEGSLRRRATTDEGREMEMVAMSAPALAKARIISTEVVAAVQHHAVPSRGVLAERRGMYLPRGVAPPVVSTSSLGSPTTAPALSEQSSASSIAQRNITAREPPSSDEDSDQRRRLLSEQDGGRRASKLYDDKGVTLTRRSTGGNVAFPLSNNVYERPVRHNPLYRPTNEGEGSVVSYAEPSVHYDEPSARTAGQDDVRHRARLQRLSDGVGVGSTSEAAGWKVSNGAPLSPPPMPSSRLREQQQFVDAGQTHNGQEDEWVVQQGARTPRTLVAASSVSTIKSIHSMTSIV